MERSTISGSDALEQYCLRIFWAFQGVSSALLLFGFVAAIPDQMMQGNGSVVSFV
jgi:hypothetical protein